MTLTELQTIIKNSGGGEFALDYAEELLAKIDNVARHQVPVNYWSQFTRTKEAGDFRGRVLEINLVNCFALKNVPLEYEVKQHGAPGDVDLKWQTNGIDVFIEVKLLGQDKATKKNIDDQIECCGFFEEHIGDDTAEILRIQRTIIDKTSLTKFVYPPLQNAVNLLAIDVSELQLGILDVADSVLATLGPETVGKFFGPAYVRKQVIGLFQRCTDPGQTAWSALIDDKLAGRPHLQDYIHGVIFLFREPKELSALSYDLKACIAWNDGLIDKELMDCITTDFHEIIPHQGS